MFELIVFYGFSLVLIIAAGMVITSRNPVHAALFLVLAFFTSAAIWLLLEAEFLAITLVLVYVGAVMVLFLFVVMMLDINLAPLREGFIRYLPVGIAVALVVVIELSVVIFGGQFSLTELPAPERAGPEYSNTKALGAVLYTVYVYPFEIAAVILLVAIVAAIALTLRRREGTRHQRPGAQVRVRREDRVRLVKMPLGAQSIMIPLSHFLFLGTVLFCLSMAGIFINRKNVLILLMSIELMLLAVNLNFVAFSHYLQDLAGQVFVFFILTVAAAEAAIGLAILVVLFRNRQTINVGDLDAMKG